MTKPSWCDLAIPQINRNTGMPWTQCKEIVGECQEIIRMGKCPKGRKE